MGAFSRRGEGMVKKKAVFFTVTALMMMAVFLFSFFVYHEYRMRNRALVIETRVSSIDNFIDDIKVDIERGVYISSFRSVLALIESITINQSYIDNVSQKFNEVFFNGTVDGDELALIRNNTFLDWESKVKDEAAKVDIELYFNNKSVEIWQDDPWNLGVKLSFTLGIGDLKSTAFWTKDMEIETKVSILNFEDPIYRIETNGLVLNAIRKKNVSFFVNQSNNNVDKLKTHNNGSYYIAWSDAPSFLKRMEGRMDESDENGIESLVDVQKLVDQGFSAKNKSVVDYTYFDNSSDPIHYKIQGMQSWFGLDNLSNGSMTHLEVYEVENITT